LSEAQLELIKIVRVSDGCGRHAVYKGETVKVYTNVQKAVKREYGSPNPKPKKKPRRR